MWIYNLTFILIKTNINTAIRILKLYSHIKIKEYGRYNEAQLEQHADSH